MRQFFDDMYGTDGKLRPAYAAIAQWLAETPPEVLETKREEAERLFRRIGITFAVYSEGGSDTERLIPFDIIPRVLDAEEWSFLERGLKQRVAALNRFLTDAYGPREIVKAGLFTDAHIDTHPAYCRQMQGVEVPGGVYTHIAGIDLVRTGVNDFYVLEDNCRTPSGVSYMLENRSVMMRLFPELFARVGVAPVARYPQDLLATLRSVAPAEVDEPVGRTDQERPADHVADDHRQQVVGHRVRPGEVG